MTRLSRPSSSVYLHTGSNLTLEAKRLGTRLTSRDVVCAGGRCECDRDGPAAGGAAVTEGAGEGDAAGVSAGDH